MDIVRVIKSKDYTTICNRIFKDRRLSLKAKGLLAMLLSLSDHWDLTVAGLEVILKEGKASIKSTINELIKHDEVMVFNNYSKEMLNDFFEYWSEPTKKGIMKKDTMKTWATSRRLKTWAKNESKWMLNSVGISKVDKHLQTHNEAMNILKQIENDKKNK